MPIDVSVAASTGLAFLLVLVRLGGVFIFLPLPGMNAAPAPVRIVLSVAFTLALSSRWPEVPSAELSLGQVTCWLAAESLYGLAIGLAVSCVLEVYTMAAQIAGLQAGFSYASTIDPSTQADSTVLLVTAHLTAGLLFFALGFDRRVLLAFAHSLETHPPGRLSLPPSIGYDLIHLTSGIFSTGLRLVLPVMALLLMLDISLGLLSRLNSHLQVLTLAFPVKILGLLGVLAFSILLFPRSAASFAETCFRLIARLT